MGTRREFSTLPRMGENRERDFTEEVGFELTIEGWMEDHQGTRTLQGMCTKAWKHTPMVCLGIASDAMIRA